MTVHIRSSSMALLLSLDTAAFCIIILVCEFRHSAFIYHIISSREIEIISRFQSHDMEITVRFIFVAVAVVVVAVAVDVVAFMVLVFQLVSNKTTITANNYGFPYSQ